MASTPEGDASTTTTEDVKSADSPNDTHHNKVHTDHHHHAHFKDPEDQGKVNLLNILIHFL